ncbi:putative Hydrolase, alpha/beta fold family [Nitrolancea hollandica Lb]|uniref:Putative Hydrolase, alpha/beta fold family n=1 Tax=Nitrolancea hollandica Lb TaxID=1129897 RepID=I4EC93_9BACT|nr:putative Hydrolase, alpha/beta fold family [Nitrolancea hollandica Lb]
MLGQPSPSPPQSRILHLPGGRRLGYAEFGDPGGLPCFFFHGIPGSRLEAAFTEDLAAQHGIRVIGIDRPGMGLSDHVPNRRFLDWPADVIAVADALGIGKFAVTGVSGGSAYVAACALAIPERLHAAAIISGMGPQDTPGADRDMRPSRRLLLALGRRAPRALALVITPFTSRAARDPQRYLDEMAPVMAEADRAVLALPDVRRILLANFTESFRQGGNGIALDLALYCHHWGFRLEDITTETHLWHGEADRNVPVAFGRGLARAISNCRAHFYPNEGHLMAITRMPEILQTLIESIRRSR